MKSQWYVSSQYINGEKHYVAERMLDKQKIKHSGNIEHSGVYMTDRSEVEELVRILNEEEIGK